MPSPEESIWWRGKHGFLVGFFPSNCVAVITDKVPRNFYLKPQMLPLSEPTKPVLRYSVLLFLSICATDIFIISNLNEVFLINRNLTKH